MHGREGARKVFEPLGEVFAAGDAREQGGVPVSGEILVSAQVDFRARAGKRGGIRTDTVCLLYTSRRGARAVAFPAGDHPGDVQGDFRTPRRLREGDVQIVAQIRARRGARPAAACTAAHAESKHIPKDIAEMSEDIFGGPKASEVAVVSDTGVTELIVPRPALRIAQHFIGCLLYTSRCV